jgi:hypothetical protein
MISVFNGLFVEDPLPKQETRRFLGMLLILTIAGGQKTRLAIAMPQMER